MSDGRTNAILLAGFVALALIGVVALFGDSLRALLEPSGPPAPEVRSLPPPGSAR
ncbi:MAG TPA: hypothetical protein VKN99_03105 [Polyangia bacterium]|nr:hypothetical protein [Polyangia bacterium]